MIGTGLVRLKNVYKDVFNPVRRDGAVALILLSFHRWLAALALTHHTFVVVEINLS